MKRREFITLLGGAAAWPLAARAQQGERVRRIAVLISIEESDPEAQARVAALRRELERLGWVDGRNVRVEYRYVAGDVDRAGRYAAEMVTQGVDVIVANSSPLLRAVQRQTRTVPTVFVQVGDPVGGGFVESMSHPGGNTTGFTSFEYSFAPKWLELLKEAAPPVVRTAVLRDPTFAMGAAQYGAIQTVAPSFGVQISPVGARDADEIERAIDVFARNPHGSLIVLPSPLATVHRDVIIASTRRTPCRRSIPTDTSRSEAGSYPMGSTIWTSIAAPPLMSTAFSRARNLPICRSNSPPSLNWSSTSRPPRRSASTSRRRSSLAPTR